jgi:hypothetical protein
MILDHLELESRGWTAIDGVPPDGLLEIAEQLGRPVVGPTGEPVKKLVPMDAVDAKALTLSATYGKGRFPLHTDTAFWPTPCRYLIFRVAGDFRRETTLLSFSRMFMALGGEFYDLAGRSIWITKGPAQSRYCSMTFRVGKDQHWRYDRQCMTPANRAASQVEEIMASAAYFAQIESVSWHEGLVLIVSNWKAMHGRGPMPAAEGSRVLERIYVE